MMFGTVAGIINMRAFVLVMLHSNYVMVNCDNDINSFQRINDNIVADVVDTKASVISHLHCTILCLRYHSCTIIRYIESNGTCAMLTNLQTVPNITTPVTASSGTFTFMVSLISKIMVMRCILIKSK